MYAVSETRGITDHIAEDTLAKASQKSTSSHDVTEEFLGRGDKKFRIVTFILLRQMSLFRHIVAYAVARYDIRSTSIDVDSSQRSTVLERGKC